MNIKKILLILILIIPFFPLITHAQAGLIECCQLKQDIDFDRVKYREDLWVGEKGCVIGETPAGADIKIEDDCIGNPIGPKETEATDGCYTAKWGMICALSSVYTVVDWIFVGLMAVVVLFTILGAFDILTAAGDPEKVKKGRERIMYAMIGLAVALLSRAVPGIVNSLIG